MGIPLAKYWCQFRNPSFHTEFWKPTSSHGEMSVNMTLLYASDQILVASIYCKCLLRKFRAGILKWCLIDTSHISALKLFWANYHDVLMD